ncbi:helix-turn-helix domain-containing protein [Paludifilum halophilum]|uniref:Helix-turn-helix domain-containing protein n=1 Tax=Paludifilum halophilum TaxID=1642702 RepID=A0A235B5L3_9BACL|nr:helix-turn-helix domain-containing protein [Paludifilum halophilum]OYD07594.1 hypothetical protein CHM34_08900 [Paludifilum halophilum]
MFDRRKGIFVQSDRSGAVKDTEGVISEVKPTKEDKLITPEEAAERLSVSPVTIRNWLRQGKMSGVKVSSLWRVREEDIEEIIQYKGRK